MYLQKNCCYTNISKKMEKVLNYIEANKDRYLSELIEFLKMPSISDIPEYKDDVRRTADWLLNHLKNIGMENCRLEETAGHPIIYCDWLNAGADKPTVLIYGHYDVQPVDPLDEWLTPPFEPTIKDDGKIYGRGTSDDKGQLFVHVKALEAILKNNGSLPVNVKIIFEGEEEAGSNHLEEFIHNNKELLSCDTAIISDTEWVTDGLPSICYSLRGICFVEIKVTGPFQDLHSGTYGGAVDNPANVLCSMIAKLKDEYGRVAIPGFYDDVLPLDEDEREEFKRIPHTDKEYCERLNIKETFGENAYTTLERTWARPTLDINGLTSGFQGEGAKTIIPAKASAKISMRLVPHQKSDDIAKKVEKYILSIAPPTVTVEVKVLHGGDPVLVQRNGLGIKSAIVALEKAFNQKPVFMREGGSIPIVGVFDEVLKAESILMGLGLPGDNIHGPNENYDLSNFFGGIKASALFFDIYGK